MDVTAQFMKVASFGALEYADCPLCGTPDGEVVVEHHMFGEDFRVVRCTSCGLIRTNPRPTPEWKRHFYDPDCNGYAESQGRDFVYAPDPKRLPGYAQLLDLIHSYSAAGSRLLDVGCASGLFVHEAKRSGFNAVGCDYSANAVAWGRRELGVEIIWSPAEAVSSSDNEYDVVTLLHVFEHLPDPRGVLREIRRILKPGGLLVLETVNYNAHYEIEKRFRFLTPLYNHLTHRQGLPWVPFDHLYHWSPETLRRAMQEAGYDEVDMHHLSGYRSEGKPNLFFGMVYRASELVGRAISKDSLNKQCFRGAASEDREV